MAYFDTRLHGTPQGERVFEIAADLLSLLSSPVRLRIVYALIEGEKTVTELIKALSLSQPNMSPHLGSLSRGRVLAWCLTGSQVFYRVAHAQVTSWCRALRVHAERPLRASGLRHRPTNLN